MMKSLSLQALLVAIALIVTGCATTQTKTATSLAQGIQLIEAVTKDSNRQAMVIPYEKYRLDNGLTVVLHQDNSDPLVHVDVTYHVGSAREQIGKSGFAHFFEHMQFQGSENVGDEQHFKIVAEAGGTLNGTTNRDRTNYYQTVPDNQLEKVLWLESDRMGYFLDAVTQQKFEIQRETVKNERGQNYDNRPYGLVYEKVSQALYPEQHPYSSTTIGYIEDLNRVNVNDLKQFFLRWYGPNNATITIGGNIDRRQTLDWVMRYFADIPRGIEVVNAVKPKVALTTDRYISYRDNINLPLIYFALPTVYARHPDEAALDVLANILGGGASSLLYKNLVKNGLAVDASANHPCSELACSFELYALPNPANGMQLASMEKIIRQSLEEFERRGVTDDDLQRVKGSIISAMVYQLESVSGKVSLLAYYQTFTDNPNYIESDIERYSNVSKQDVLRVFKQYIKSKPAVILSVVPQAQTNLRASTDTFIYQRPELPNYTATNAGDLQLRIAQSKIDRSIQPSAGISPSLKIPKLWRATLANGIEVLGSVNTEVPTTALKISFEAGQQDETAHQSGLANLTAAMLDESSQLMSKEAISNQLQKIGSQFSFSSDDFYSTIYIKSLTEHLAHTLELTAGSLFEPKFDNDEFIKVKNQVIQTIENNKKEASITANQVMLQLLFGSDNHFSRPNLGSVDSVTKLSLNAVKRFYKHYYQPQSASLLVVSNLSKDEVLKQLNWLGDWSTTAIKTKRTAIKAAPQIAQSTLYFIDKPDAAQSEIRMFKPALLYDASGQYFRSDLMNYALGEAFNSRINLNLREDKGYTYGARSYFVGNQYYGYYVAKTSVRSDVTLQSVQQILKELNQYQQLGPTADEWQFTQNSIGQRDARAFETPSQKLSFLDKIQRYHLQPQFIDQQQRILKNMTIEDAAKLAAKHLDTNSMNILVMGDKQSVLPKLQTLGYKIVELDANGKAL